MINNSISEIESYLDKNMYSLPKEFIYSAGENDMMVRNVISLLSLHSFSLAENKNHELISFIYITNEPDLQGFDCKIDISNKLRNEILFQYCKIIEYNYPNNTDAISCFNTFQHYFRSYVENLGYFTFGSEIEDIHGDIIIKTDKGVLFAPTIDQLKAYKYVFKDVKPVALTSTNSKVYLMFNPKNRLTKIGFSKNPKFREKTLQGEEPNTEIIAMWEVNRKIEKELHSKFEHKRTRGEWFNLNFADLQNIKSFFSTED